VVHSEAATAFGGQEHRIYKEMIAMRARGHHMEAIVQSRAQLVQRLQDEGFTVHKVDMKGPVAYLKAIAAVRRILARGNYDVLNTHSRRDTIIAGSAGRVAGVPLIVRTRHLAIPPGSLLSYTWIPHRITTVSDHVRDNLLRRGVPPDHVATLYSPIVLPPPIERSTLRDELGLADDDIVVGCVAVMRPRKGHRTLVDAMLPLLRERSTLHLVFIGSGEPVYTQLQAYIAELGLQGRIHLMGTRRDVPNLLAGCDLFALATEQEASGTVYVEAEAAGLPVVGTNVGGVSEMMRDGQTGFLVPLGDVAALTAALRRLIDDPELRRRMGEAGRRMIREEGVFSTERLAERTEAVYRRWLQGRRGHAHGAAEAS
jgi:glycosyltransferase involved in cell wall biosynthesis